MGTLAGLGFTALTLGLIRPPQIFGRFGVTEPAITGFLGINAQGGGTIGMLLSFATLIGVKPAYAAARGAGDGGGNPLSLCEGRGFWNRPYGVCWAEHHSAGVLE